MLGVVEKEAVAATAVGAPRVSLLQAANTLGLLFVTLLLIITISFVTPSFLSPFNVFAVTRNLASDAIIGFAMMAVLALGHMNLAVGAIGVCAVMVTGYTLEHLGLPIPLAVLAALATGGVLGALNGLLVVRSGVQSFIITLATASLYLGLMLILTHAEAFRNLPPEFSALGNSRVGSISGFLVITLIVYGALVLLFDFSVLGRQILATGANIVAAGLSGVPVNRVIILAHALSGVLAGVAGVLVTARLAAALPSVGEDWVLPSFLGPLIGGTLLAGGFVSVSGALLGAILVSVLQNGLVLLNVSGFWIQFFLGLTLLAAVGLDRWRSVLVQRAGRRLT